jgi:hypothetical protein
MSDDRKDLPPVSAPNFNERLRETISTYLGNRGSKLDRGLTLRDLTEANIIKLRDGYLAGAGGSGRPIAGLNANLLSYEVDLSPPPPPSGLSAITSGTSIQVTVDPQTYRQGHGPAKVTVFGAKYLAGDALPTYANAAVLDEFSGDVHAFPVDSASLYRIWAKSVTVDGVESALAGGANGVAPTDGLLDDVSIASLTASKIRSGSITVGQFIQAANYVPGLAGWRINGDGTAELANAVVRGGVYATYGLIGGNAINSTGMQSPGYVANTSGWRLDSNGSFYANTIALRGYITGGAFTGYSWPAAGAGDGFYLGPGGLLLGNENDGQYFQVTSAGRVRAPGLDINAGVATFSGNLSAAGGTFAGALQAARGTFSGALTADAINAVNTINLAGNSVTVPVSASASAAMSFVSETTILTSPSIDATYGSVVIILSVSFTFGYTATDGVDTAVSSVFNVYRNGILIRTVIPAITIVSDVITDTPGGAATYTVTGHSPDASTAAVARQRTIVVLGVKR